MFVMQCIEPSLGMFSPNCPSKIQIIWLSVPVSPSFSFYLRDILVRGFRKYKGIMSGLAHHGLKRILGIAQSCFLTLSFS